MYRLTITDREGGILLRHNCPTVTAARERANRWWAEHRCVAPWARFHLTAQDGSTLDGWDENQPHLPWWQTA